MGEEAKKTATRVYLVVTPNGKHLVEAVSQAQALRHVALKTMKISVPSVKDAMSAGVPVEVAGEDVDDGQEALPI